MRLERLASVALALVLGSALVLPASAQELVTPRPSPGASVKQTVGTTDLTVNYSRPGVKGRVIWGGLVPYDKPWRTGANEATQFVCTDDVEVEGQKLVVRDLRGWSRSRRRRPGPTRSRSRRTCGCLHLRPEAVTRCASP